MGKGENYESSELEFQSCSYSRTAKAKGAKNCSKESRKEAKRETMLAIKRARQQERRAKKKSEFQYLQEKVEDQEEQLTSLGQKLSQYQRRQNFYIKQIAELQSQVCLKCGASFRKGNQELEVPQISCLQVSQQQNMTDGKQSRHSHKNIPQHQHIDIERIQIEEPQEQQAQNDQLNKGIPCDFEILRQQQGGSFCFENSHFGGSRSIFYLTIICCITLGSLVYTPTYQIRPILELCSSFDYLKAHNNLESPFDFVNNQPRQTSLPYKTYKDVSRASEIYFLVITQFDYLGNVWTDLPLQLQNSINLTKQKTMEMTMKAEGPILQRGLNIY